MSTEELPDDLDKLKITSKNKYTNLCDRNPFYSPITTSSTETILLPIQSTKQIINCKMRRIRRRSESNIDDFNNKQLDIPVAADYFEIVNPLRCLPGVNKLNLKRSNFVNSKRNLLREPVLRIAHDNIIAKGGFGSRERSRSNFHKPRTSINIKSSINGICSFRDLISECNILLDESKSKKETFDNSLHLTKNFLTCQRRPAASQRGAETSGEQKEDGQASNFRDQTSSSSSSRLSCSQEAGNSASNPRNCDDVTIVELASYFDTMVHIPKKMSSMAEMMYI